MRGILHKCSNFEWKKFEPVYAQRYKTVPGSDRNAVKSERKRHFQRIGYLCSTCGFHSTDRPGQVPRYVDSERLAIAFAMADSDTLQALQEMAHEFGLSVQLAAPELSVDSEVNHGNS